MVTICDFGCSSVDGCFGQCQPAPLIRTGKRCRWCDEGWRLQGTDHWVVKGFSPPTINIRSCAAFKASRVTTNTGEAP